MTKKLKRNRKQSKPRHLVRFPAFEVFPPSDLIGLDLLCLMSAYNDMVRITDWMHAHYHLPRDPLAIKIDNGRSSMEWRYIIGILHEVRVALERMTKNNHRFPEIETRLDSAGRHALTDLKRYLDLDQPALDALPNTFSKFLNDVRNKGAFHYIRNHFEEGLRALKSETEKPDSTLMQEDGFIIEGTEQKGRLRFIFADTVRNAAAFGVKDVNSLIRELELNMEKVTALMGHLNQFLQSALIAHLELQNFNVTKTDDGFTVNRK